MSNQDVKAAYVGKWRDYQQKKLEIHRLLEREMPGIVQELENSYMQLAQAYDELTASVSEEELSEIPVPPRRMVL